MGLRWKQSRSWAGTDRSVREVVGGRDLDHVGKDPGGRGRRANERGVCEGGMRSG